MFKPIPDPRLFNEDGIIFRWLTDQLGYGLARFTNDAHVLSKLLVDRLVDGFAYETAYAVEQEAKAIAALKSPFHAASLFCRLHEIMRQGRDLQTDYPARQEEPTRPWRLINYSASNFPDAETWRETAWQARLADADSVEFMQWTRYSQAAPISVPRWESPIDLLVLPEGWTAAMDRWRAAGGGDGRSAPLVATGLHIAATASCAAHLADREGRSPLMTQWASCRALTFAGRGEFAAFGLYDGVFFEPLAFWNYGGPLYFEQQSLRYSDGDRERLEAYGAPNPRFGEVMLGLRPGCAQALDIAIMQLTNAVRSASSGEAPAAENRKLHFGGTAHPLVLTEDFTKLLQDARQIAQRDAGDRANADAFWLLAVRKNIAFCHEDVSCEVFYKEFAALRQRNPENAACLLNVTWPILSKKLQRTLLPLMEIKISDADGAFLRRIISNHHQGVRLGKIARRLSGLIPGSPEAHAALTFVCGLPRRDSEGLVFGRRGEQFDRRTRIRFKDAMSVLHPDTVCLSLGGISFKELCAMEAEKAQWKHSGVLRACISHGLVERLPEIIPAEVLGGLRNYRQYCQHDWLRELAQNAGRVFPKYAASGV
jgi:hypothetical protein